MRKEKWDSYMNAMQGHPSIAYTDKSAEGMKKMGILDRLDMGRCLCLGAADGAEVRALCDIGYKAVGITLGQNNVDYGKKEYNVELYLMDMHDLLFGANTFQSAYSSHCFEHSLSPWIHVFEVRRVLKDGGKWWLNYPICDLGGSDTTRPSCHHPNCNYSDVQREMFEYCGFAIDYYEHVGSEYRFLLRKDNSIRVSSAVKTVFNDNGY